MKAKPIVVNIEIATLDLELALERYINLYRQRGVKMAKNFATHLREVWDKSQGEIGQTARNLHYNTVAVIPGKVKLPEFHKQMTRGYNPTWKSYDFQENGSWAGIKSFQAESDRVVLFHDCLKLPDHSLTKQLLGQSLVQVTGLSETELNDRIVQGKPFKGQLTIDGQQQTFDGLAVEDYLAIQAEVYSRTKCHLDTKTFSWLIRSRCGRRVPALYWYPEDGQLDAYAIEPGSRSDSLAPRPAAVFV